jgi:hypothetical protein
MVEVIRLAKIGRTYIMKDVTYEEAIAFLDLLVEKMPDWTYDNWDPEIEYIREVLWRDNDMRTS